MEYNEFDGKYANEAAEVDLLAHPIIYKVLQKQKIKLETATLQEEKAEVKEFSAKAIMELKHRLRIAYSNEAYKGNYVNHTAPFLLDMKLLSEYTDLYNKANNSEPQQLGNQSQDKSGNKYPHIFKNNAFEVWQSMFDDFAIDETSRTDVKFMYEEMKRDGLIHNTISQKDFLSWVSKTYEIEVNKTSNYSKTKQRQSIYYNAKQRYKSKDV